MNVNDAVRIRIEELRIQSGLTLSGLADLCGVNFSTMHGIVYGEHKSVTLASLQKICDGLEIDLADFFHSEIFYDLDP